MRTRGAAIQGGLAALGLLAAWATWQREPERAPGEVVVVDASKNDLTSVRYDDDKKWVELSATKEAGETVVWMKIAANEQQKSPERVLRGNEGAVKLWERFAPLRGSRALGKLAADKLKELGLDASKKKITIVARGTHTLEIGTSPFGVSDPYVKDAGSGEVYVLGGGVVADLDSAGMRLVDRTLHGFKTTEFDALTVSAGGKKRELVQTSPETPATAKLASKKTPTKPDDLVKNWHDKLWRMFPVDLLGKNEVPKSGQPVEVLKVEYLGKGAQKGYVVIGRVALPPQPPPAVSIAPAPPAQPSAEFYARTERTAGWVKVPPTTEDLLKEAEKIAAQE